MASDHITFFCGYSSKSYLLILITKFPNNFIGLHRIPVRISKHRAV